MERGSDSFVEKLPGVYFIGMENQELVFEVAQEEDGGFTAECLTENIFTQADTWEELRKNVREATTAYFFDGKAPAAIRLHFVRDEVLTAA
jgi:predicted RNase H-like HicB family nuclease